MNLSKNLNGLESGSSPVCLTEHLRGPLQLSAEEGDFGADDFTGTPIEEHVPDYDILEDIDYTYPVNDAYFGYASRGCIRKCHFCGVPKLGGMQKEMPPLSKLIEGIEAKYGPKKDLILMDNNINCFLSLQRSHWGNP